MLVDNFLYPVSAVRSHFSQSINWSGIRYYLKDGKISKVSWSRLYAISDLLEKVENGVLFCIDKMNFCSCFLNQNEFVCIFCRLKELKEARTWIRFSQTWVENIYMARKGCLRGVHSSVLCLELWRNGINLRNLITRKGHDSAINLCLFSLS